MYSAVTRNIEVNVEPFYLEDRSDPAEDRYVWAYRVTIDNQSDELREAAVALLAHHRRRRATSRRCAAPGVVGEQPELNPGDSYQYTSGCPLSTPSGIMVGRYTMRNAPRRDLRRRHSRLLARHARQAANGELRA